MDQNGHPRIGVYICHCGLNIAGTVNVAEVREFISHAPNVTIARDYKFMCSDPGQALIQDDIRKLGVNRVVVAACSPLMHEITFRNAAKKAGLNRYLVQIANIREHCSWIHDDIPKATEKAKALVAGAVRRVALHQPWSRCALKLIPTCWWWVAGLPVSRRRSKSPSRAPTVYLVEREPTIGGRMAQFDKTFPTLDCAACILTPKMVSVGHRENIKLLSYSEVVGFSGFIGNFKVKVRRKSRFVDESKCTGCGLCWNTCPATRVPAKRTIKMGDRIVKQVA